MKKNVLVCTKVWLVFCLCVSLCAVFPAPSAADTV
jgi:hypothetical protein